ncbi:YmfQ family protein [Paenibacillus guangzhouensis]|uniref:YmfQ family protein n=1 Tax=Paenibacillus guangzhouensis TaxID=1473112 RepID=UPI0012672C6E|nr:YmfQ family protein [Paenibacillus guangzhouensis]
MTDVRERAVIERAVGNNPLRRYVPEFVSGSRILGGMLDSQYQENQELTASIDEVLDQFYIETATWGLDRWERMCGIATDPSKPLDQRRSVIKSKLRGIGTVTVDLVKNVAEAFANGQVDVQEDVAKYTITVTFVGKLGIPPNMEDITHALRDIIPAHLGIEYVYKFYPYYELAKSGKKYQDLTSLTYYKLVDKGVQ